MFVCFCLYLVFLVIYFYHHQRWSRIYFYLIYLILSFTTEHWRCPALTIIELKFNVFLCTQLILSKDVVIQSTSIHIFYILAHNLQGKNNESNSNNYNHRHNCCCLYENLHGISTFNKHLLLNQRLLSLIILGSLRKLLLFLLYKLGNWDSESQIISMYNLKKVKTHVSHTDMSTCWKIFWCINKRTNRMIKLVQKRIQETKVIRINKRVLK